jgi:6-phosphogluconolactonase (cycloisomerase 2 family)
MKWNRLSRGAKALAVSLALGLGVSACSRDYTVAFLYVTTAKANPGLINAYAVDYQLGSLVQLAQSPTSSAGADPVDLVVSTNTAYTNGNAQFLYVINHTTSNVVEFSIGINGNLTQLNSYTVVNGTSLPTSIAMDATDTFLYVTFQYQPGYSATNPGPGGIAVFPINTDGSLGTPLTNTTVGASTAHPLSYYPVGNNPVGITVTNSFCTPGTAPSGYASCTTSAGVAGFITIPSIYVVDQETVNTVPTGVVLGFTQGYNLSTKTPTGTLTTITGGTVLGGFAAGSVPAAIVVDPTGRYVYVTDQATNQIFGDIVLNNGALSPMVDSPFPTGLLPLGVTVDPRGEYVYVANYASQSVSGFSINTATGQLSGTGTSTATATGPTCVTIEPARGIYLYTSNSLDGSVSGMSLDPHSGALTSILGTPYPSAGLPTCAAAAASGSHSTQVLNP